MSTTTSRAGIFKPENGDGALIIPSWAGCMDTIDAGLGNEVFTASTRPASGFSGKAIYNSTYKAAEVRDGTAWVRVSATIASTLTGVTPTHQGALGVETSTKQIKLGNAAVNGWDNLIVPASTQTVQFGAWYRAATQSLANNTDVRVDFDTAEARTTTFVSKTTNASGSGGGSRFTFLVAGVYSIMAQVHFDANTTGRRDVHIVNAALAGGAGNNNIRYGSAQMTAPSSASPTVQVSAETVFAVGDAIEVWANQNSGGALNIKSETFGPQPRISIRYCGA
jgi:hypothetical protein